MRRSEFYKGAFSAMFMLFALGGSTIAQMQIEYDPAKKREPHDPALGLGFWAAETGRATFSNVAMLTVDRDTEDHPGGWGLYYRRQFSEEEFNDRTDLRIEVTVKVLSSTVSPASTCVQFTTNDGRTFGLGFLRTDQTKIGDRVILYADDGEPLPIYSAHAIQDWLLNPAILGSYSVPVNVKRTYVLELLRHGPGGRDDLVRLSIEGSNKKPLTARLADLKRRATVPGLVFGHPVTGGAGQALWYRLTVITTGKTGPAELPRRIGTRRQLFLDDWIIDKTKNLERQVEKPEKYPGNPVMRRDKPWDASRCDLYGSAVWNPQGQKLQLFYSAVSTIKQHDDRLAYVESRDGGRTWVKPALDLIPFGRRKKTNILLAPRNGTLMGPCVFRDDQDGDPSGRYKLFTADYGARPDGRPCEAGIYVALSPDGIHWDPSTYKRVLPLVSDTAHSAFWDQRIGKYVGYIRMRPKKYGRAVGRTESDDFEHWTPPELCFVPPQYQFYSMGVTPYQDIYIGTVWILWNKSKDIDAHDPVISPGLAVSRDGWTWQMVTDLADREELIPTGSPGSRDDRQIRMSNSLVVLEDRILFIYGQTDRPHIPDMRVDVGLATLRLDGFVAMAAGEKTGRLLSRPFVFEGDELYINAACDKNGSITVAMLDETGKALPGFEHRRCRRIRGDGIKLPVSWQEHLNLSQWRGKPVRLEFVLKQAKLYSFWFQDNIRNATGRQPIKGSKQ